MSTKNFSNSVISKLFYLLLTLAFLSSCNVLKEVLGGKTELENPPRNMSPYKDIIGFWNFNDVEPANTYNSYSVVNGGFPDLSVYNGGEFGTLPGKLGPGLDCDTRLIESNEMNFDLAAENGVSFSFWASDNSSSSAVTLFRLEDEYGGELFRLSTDGSAGPDGVPIQLNTNVHDPVTEQFTNVDFEGESWHHFAVVMGEELETVDFYLNGELLSSESGTVGAVAHIAKKLVLCDGTPYNRFTVDSVGLWRRALTPAEVHGLYSGQNPLD